MHYVLISSLYTVYLFFRKFGQSTKNLLSASLFDRLTLILFVVLCYSHQPNLNMLILLNLSAVFQGINIKHCKNKYFSSLYLTWTRVHHGEPGPLLFSIYSISQNILSVRQHLLPLLCWQNSAAHLIPSFGLHVCDLKEVLCINLWHTQLNVYPSPRTLSWQAWDHLSFT